MSVQSLPNLYWYTDPTADQRSEPGIHHSFIASLATAFNYIHGKVDPIWLMGSSAFAFRIWISPCFCPSCMSVFRWEKILPASLENAGYHYTYISRMWEEKFLEEERRQQAHSAIVHTIDRGIPAVVWDVAEVEWGLITGYDDTNKKYSVLSCLGKPDSLPYEKLGRNGIDILSVIIPGEPKGCDRAHVFRRSLEAAVAHAEQKEWLDRSNYQDGIPAFETWALCYDHWAALSESGKMNKVEHDIPRFARDYASSWYGARCYARDYLRNYGNGSDGLNQAMQAYARTSEALKPVWEDCPKELSPDPQLLRAHAKSLRTARSAEEEAIHHIREWLD